MSGPYDPLAEARRRIRARQIAFLRSAPDPSSPYTTRQDMQRLFGGLPTVLPGDPGDPPPAP